MNQLLKFLMISSFWLALNNLANAAIQPIAPEIATTKSTKALVFAKNSMVVTNNPWATKVALQILKDGGNATDAAIAAGFVLGLTEPQSSGIGGGGYILNYTNNKLIAYDGRETAPSLANPEWFLTKDKLLLSFESAMLSAKSVGVPAEVALFYKMHSEKGRLPWRKLLQPAINLAKTGFPMTPRLYNLLIADASQLKNNPKINEIYFDSNGQVKAIGSIIKNLEYAKSLIIIAKNPRDFYTGKIATDIVTTINNQARQQLFTMQDLANYQVLSYQPVCGDYRNKYIICSVPPSSSGGVTLIELMNLYANSYLANNYDDANWVYKFIEASKLAYADRNQYLADPHFVTQPIVGLLDKQYLLKRSQLISKSAMSTPVAAGVPQGIDTHYAPDNSKKPHGTSSVAIVDKYGNAVSMTVTIEHQFGSHLFVDGFFLNNELTDFSFKPSASNGQLIANRVEANKRPRSSIAPTMVFDKSSKQLYAIAGSPGGSQIICYVAKNLIQMLDMDMTPEAAAASGNLCAVNNTPIIESNTELAIHIPALKLLGELATQAEMVSGETNIKRTKNGWFGGADPRREGVAAGL